MASNCIVGILIFFVLQSYSKIIELPTTTTSELQYLRTQSLLFLQKPFEQFGNLEQVYKREAYEVKQSGQSTFSACRQVEPYIEFDVTAQRWISDQRVSLKPRVVYKFEDIQFRKHLIDIIYFQNRVFYMLESGRVKAERIDWEKRIIEKMPDKYAYNSSQKAVNSGYFIKLYNDPIKYPNETIVFLNEKQMIIIDAVNNGAGNVQSYQGKEQFQNYVSLGQGFIAVASGVNGVDIYHINSDALTVSKVADSKDILTPSLAGILKFNIRDLAFDGTRGVLFLLERSKGLLPFKIEIKNGKLNYRFISSTISKPNCEMLYYYEAKAELYLSCNELYKYKIDNWPIIQEISLPPLEISLREIIINQKITTFVGRNIFQVIYAQRKAASFQDRLLDKLLLVEKDYFISANENSILVGQYFIRHPSIQCSTKDQSLIGNHKILLKTTAECNQKYLNKVGIKEKISPYDKCVYSTYLNIEVWSAAEFKAAPFAITLIFLIIILLFVMMWCVYSAYHLHRMQTDVTSNYNIFEEEEPPASRRSDQQKDSGKEVELQQKYHEEHVSEEVKQQMKDQLQNNQFHDIE